MSADNPTVTYRGIPDFPGYRVGDDGSVWSCWKRIQLGRPKGCKFVLSEEWKRLKQNPRGYGYVAVDLCRDGKARHKMIHRLVLLAFVGPCPLGKQVAHENGNPRDNRLTNLSYKTPKENHADRLRHGTLPWGEEHCSAKLTAADVQEIRAQYQSGARTKDLAKRYNVLDSTILRAVKKRTWKRLA